LLQNTAVMAVSDPAGAVPPAAVADAAERQLDPRFIPLQRTIGWIVAAVIATGSLLLALVVWAASGFSWLVLLVLAPAWMAVNAAFAWLFHRWPQVEYRHTFYRVDDEGIEIRRGVYWRVVINVPRSRVQHTDVSQGPLERKFGLGTLVVYTAGTDHARVDLGGLDHADAMRIRAHLLPGEADDAV
jgi:membrane protein YdbS with pleckstrin-like domain